MDEKVVAEYLPAKVHKNMGEFLKHRELKLVSGSVATRKAQKVITDTKQFLSLDTFTQAVQMVGYVVLEAADLPTKNLSYRKQVAEVNRNLPTKTFIVIIDMNSKYAAQSPEFVTMLKRVPGFDHDKRDYNMDIIIISKDKLSSHIHKKINIYKNYGTETAGFTHVETHQYFVFYTNVMDPNNALIPHHSIVPREEEAATLGPLYAEKKDLPCIPQCDPPVVWIGGEVGDIIQIVQASESAGEDISYRIVIPPKLK